MFSSDGAAKVAPFFNKRVLHVGCGGDTLPDWLSGAIETRLDIDESHRPDIIGSMTELGNIGPFDVVLASHCLEHLELSDVNKALSEFARVLDRGGFAFVIVPDLQDVTPDDDVIMFSPSGPITGFDMIYGHSGYTKTKPYMQHKSGFIKKTLEKVMQPYFQVVNVRRSSHYNLIGVGVK
jgi:SAM-dependent methyltransferase